jgi:hypothetical protein
MIVFLHSAHRLLVRANVVPSSQIHVTMMIKEIRSSETSGLTGAALRNIPEEVNLLSCIIHSYPKVS